MKTTPFIAFAVAYVLLQTAGTFAQARKYGGKSGIVTLENTIKMAGTTITHKRIVYFDDYGMQERKDDYRGERLQQSFLSDGKELYKVIYAEKTAYRSGKAFRGTELKVDWNEISDSDKKSGKAKKLADINIVGKDCEPYEYSARGTTSKFAGWKGICFLQETSSGGMITVVKAVKFEENAKIADGMFKVPSAFTVK